MKRILELKIPNTFDTWWFKIFYPYLIVVYIEKFDICGSFRL